MSLKNDVTRPFELLDSVLVEDYINPTPLGGVGTLQGFQWKIRGRHGKR